MIRCYPFRVARPRRSTFVAAGAVAVVMGACGGSGGSSGGGSGAAPVTSPSSAGNNRLPGTQSTTDACTVVTQAEASTAMGEPVNSGQRGAKTEFDSISKAGQPVPDIGDHAVLSSGTAKGTASDELIAQKGKVILDLLLTTSTSKQRTRRVR